MTPLWLQRFYRYILFLLVNQLCLLKICLVMTARFTESTYHFVYYLQLTL